VKQPSAKKTQCLKVIAKLVTDCGKSKRPTFQHIVDTLEKLAKDMYPNNEKMQELVTSNGTSFV
jgi:hypothetical protein